MNRIKTIFLFVVMAILPVFLHAQSVTNSPYTRYGYGNLADRAFANQRGMGGIGYGLQNSKMINPLNPASYSSVDSMTFMLDLGVTAQNSWFEDHGNKVSKYNGGIDYVAIQFPLAKKIGMGFGLEPVSFVGYNYGDTTYLPSLEVLSQQTYHGSGGLSKVYGSLSYCMFDRLSLGVNFGYLFGDIYHYKTSSYNTTSSYITQWSDSLRASGMTYNLGVQYRQPIGKTKSLVLGAVYTPKTKISGRYSDGMMTYDPNTGVVYDSENLVDRNQGFEMPESYAVGITFNEKNKYTFGVDYLLEKWADAEYFSKTDTLSNRTKINLGGEYIPNAYSRNLLHRIAYRAGAYVTDSYINVNGSGYKEYGASVGLGIPMNDRRSYLNLAIEYSAVRPEAKNLIDEQYFKVTLSYTFNELWFFKRKVQ